MRFATTPSMLIGTVMTPHVVACCAGDTLERATQLMWDNDVGFLPVVDGSNRLIGVITDRDALMAAYTRGGALAEHLVGSTMARSPFTCTIHDEAKQIEHRMAAHRVRRLPVIDPSGKPVGVVTLSDLARASMHGHELSSRSPTWALAEITRPHRNPDH
jgi:CBS domain-containing protein